MDAYPRPSHADWTYQEKYGVRASRYALIGTEMLVKSID